MEHSDHKIEAHFVSNEKEALDLIFGSYFSKAEEIHGGEKARSSFISGFNTYL